MWYITRYMAWYLIYPAYITSHSDISKNTRDIDMTKKYQLLLIMFFGGGYIDIIYPPELYLVPVGDTRLYMWHPFPPPRPRYTTCLHFCRIPVGVRYSSCSSIFIEWCSPRAFHYTYIYDTSVHINNQFLHKKKFPHQWKRVKRHVINWQKNLAKLMDNAHHSLASWWEFRIAISFGKFLVRLAV